MRTNLCWTLLGLWLAAGCTDAAPGATFEGDDLGAESDAGPDATLAPAPDAGLTPADAAATEPEPEPGAACDPETAICRATLTTSFEGHGGIDLATGAQTTLPTDGSAPGGAESPVDLTLWLGRFLGISGMGPEALCEVGVGYATLGDVPTDAAGCTWGAHSFLGVLTNPYSDPNAPGRGLLVRDRRGERLYVLWILEDSVGSDDELGNYIGRATFDYTLVPR
jgi:hypothetical protein